MSRYEVVLSHWAPGTGFTHSETIDWLQDADTVEHYVKSIDYPIEPYWNGGDTEVKIIEHMGGANDPTVLYDSAMVSEVRRLSEMKRVYHRGDTHAQPLTAEQLNEPVTSYDNTSLYEEVIKSEKMV